MRVMVLASVGVLAVCSWGLLAGSALTLLVPRIRADDHDPAMPANDPALAADLLHTRLNLHRGLLQSRATACPAPSVRSLVPVDNPAAAQVIRTQFHDDPVIGQDPDVVHPHLPADVGEDLVPVV